MALTVFLLGVLLLGAFLLLARWFAAAEPRTLLKAARVVGYVLAGGVVVWLAVSGRLWLVVGMATAAAPFILRLVSRWRSARNYARMAGAPSGRSSTVESRFLRMTLEHDSGAIDGEVIEGAYAGRRLGNLSRQELLALLGACQAEDAPSARLLEAYLDRTAEGWRDDAAEQYEGRENQAHGHADRAEASPAMSEAEAYRVLGLNPGASADDIRTAYHRLIALLHPDRGGSSFLAAQVNRARDILLHR